MSHFDAVTGAFTASLRNWRLWTIQFLVNAVLFASFAGWLLIPVANAFHIILNITVILFICLALLVLHGGTLNYFRAQSNGGEEITELPEGFRRALRNILPIIVCLAVVWALWLLLAKLDPYQHLVPPYLRSISPVSLRRHFSLAFFQGMFDALFFTLHWIIFPGLLLPFVASVSSLGFRGFAREGLSAWKRTVSSIWYWIILTAAAVVGVVATQKLMDWTPDFRHSTLRRETISVVWRTTASYLLGLSAWMLTCSVLGSRGGSGNASDDLRRQTIA